MSGKSSPLAHDLKRNDAIASLSAFGETNEERMSSFKEMSWAEQVAFLKEYGDVLTEVDSELQTNLVDLNK